MANNDERNREQEIFNSALEIASAKGRLTYVKRACGEDAVLLARVEALLQAHEAPKGFLPERPGQGATVRLVIEKEGDKVGNYKLLQQIGEGGCGVVYMAEQAEPIRRRVALKVIKLGMDTKQVIARFEAERQALALMDHPNIARVLDAGTTEAGRPFFVMELVRGVRITEYCDENHLSTEERLQLFVQICHAIQHAHQKGVIHRDIKPSNILVTINDGVPAPKVIDFGIAKAIGQQLTDKTVFTAFEQFIGTPAYMSPEQAVMTSLDIDTRSDVYALGVLLYELLTGHTPFEQRELLAVGLDQMRRIIREQEPIRPSTRLSTLEHAEQTTVAKRRSSEFPELVHTVRGDLDWIVMKALEKDRTRRYETANSFADDILRHLQNEPVMACPPSFAYRMQKSCRRNRLVFTAAGAVGLALVLGLGLSTWLLFRERAAHALALKAEKAQSQLRQQAQAEARKSEQVAGMLKDMLQGLGPSVAQGLDPTMLRQILDKTAERLGKHVQGQPEVEAELRHTLGEVYFALGQYATAESMHRRALEIRRSLWGKDSTKVADALDGLGRAILYNGYRPDEAEPYLQEAFTIRTNLLPAGHPQIATSLLNLGEVRVFQVRNSEAEDLLYQSLALRKQLLGNDSPEVAEVLDPLAAALAQQGRAVESEAAAREAIAIWKKTPGGGPACDQPDPRASLGFALFLQHKLDEAEHSLREVLNTKSGILGREHPYVAGPATWLAQVLLEKGELKEARELAAESAATGKKLYGSGSVQTAYPLGVLGRVLHKQGKLAEAESAFREELSVWEQWPLVLGNEFQARSELMAVLQQQGKLNEAEACYRQAIGAVRKRDAPQALAAMLAGFGDLLRGQGKGEQAGEVYREGLDLCRRASPVNCEHEQWLAAGLALVLKEQGKLAEAEACYREAVTNSARAWSNDPARWQWQLEDLMDVLQRQGKLAEAEQIRRDFAAPDAQASSSADAENATAQGEARGQHGRWNEATRFFTNAIGLEPTNHFLYHKLAPLLAYTTNYDAYQQHCGRIVQRFANADDPYVSERMAKDCLLLPCSGANPVVISNWLQNALSVPANHPALPWFYLAKGLEQYRQSHFAQAIEWELKATLPAESSPKLSAAAFSIIAMAQWRLQHDADARATLARAVDITESKMPGLASGDLGQDWQDSLIAHVLLREAKALVTGKPHSAQE